ncbi:MAG TPA: histidine ammonia-lyase [Vicinamibacterales bacterium]|nr:histidine ammonia-lyase [Vicinamibacterales bacterium]
MPALDGRGLTLEQLAAIADACEPVSLAPDARARVDEARRVVEAVLEGDAPVYGVNTGFGSFADVRIGRDDLDALQVNLVRSHAAGVGDPLPARLVRAMAALRINVLARGHSGIRSRTIDALVAMLNAGVHPIVPSRGSVGASGDLAPLAHLALVLIGEGEAEVNGRRLPGREALAAAGLSPVSLAAKEGLALINGTQASAAILALALLDAERLARTADIAAALSIDALRGSSRPFDPRIHEARGLDGQRRSAANIAALMAGSAINASHANCGRVQDAYSMRCAAQVHGAAREALGWVRGIVAREINASTDNPMVFADTGEVVSGGNFHGAPVALAADMLAIGVTQIATISERRCERLVNPALSGLPGFLTREGGLQSGLMMAQVTAAALASELKGLAHPASADTIPTSGNKEDHVSMSMTAALKAARAVALARTVLAIELLCASQAIDLLAPLTTSAPLTRVHRRIRDRVPMLEADRAPSPDIAAIDDMIAAGDVESAAGMPVT